MGGLGKGMTDLEGRLAGVESQVSRHEFATRANSMMWGGGGGILDVVTIEDGAAPFLQHQASSGLSYTRPASYKYRRHSSLSMTGAPPQPQSGNTSRRASTLYTDPTVNVGIDVTGALLHAYIYTCIGCCIDYTVYTMGMCTVAAWLGCLTQRHLWSTSPVAARWFL